MRLKSALLTAACLVASFAFGAAPTPVTFRFFEYSGHDDAFEAPLPEGDYRNPILAGFYPDPSVCRVGDDVYLVNSTFAYFPGIPVFHSKDLVHWQQIGNVISRPTQLKYDGLTISRGIFAPTIRYHDGLFYVVCTLVDAGGNFVVTAKNPAGPWSDPTFLPFDGIDPSLFFDTDGKAWLVNNGAPEGKPLYPGHRAIWLQQFDPKTLQLVGPRTVLVNGGVDLARQPVWIEGPHLYRRGEWYYLSCAEGGTSENHSQVIFRSHRVTGPFEPWSGNPILTQRGLPEIPGAVTSTGHADFVEMADGSWWSVFLGCQPYKPNTYNTGRETFLLPVYWNKEGWPTILRAGARVPLVAPAPGNAALPPIAERGVPLTGNFTWRDDFTERDLSPLWLMLRAPHDRWWEAGGADGGIRLTPQADTLSGTGHPAFLGRRVQHTDFEATAALELPSTPGVSAGLAVFQNETHHYFFGIRRTPAGAEVFVECARGGNPVVLATKPLEGDAVVALRIEEEGPTIGFRYSSRQGGWQTLLDHADATVLSTKSAGGFVGATVGLHARIDPR